MKFKFRTEVEITGGFYRGQKGEVAYPIFLSRFFGKKIMAYHVLIERTRGTHRDVIVREEHLKEVKKSKVKGK